MDFLLICSSEKLLFQNVFLGVILDLERFTVISIAFFRLCSNVLGSGLWFALGPTRKIDWDAFHYWGISWLMIIQALVNHTLYVPVWYEVRQLESLGSYFNMILLAWVLGHLSFFSGVLDQVLTCQCIFEINFGEQVFARFAFTWLLTVRFIKTHDWFLLHVSGSPQLVQK